MTAYLRNWLPYWTACALAGISGGLVIGIAIIAATSPSIAPLYLVLLEASLAYLRTVRGHRGLIAAMQRACNPQPVRTQI